MRLAGDVEAGDKAGTIPPSVALLLLYDVYHGRSICHEWLCVLGLGL